MNEAHLQLRRILDDVRDKTGLEVRLMGGKDNETAFTLEYCGEKIRAYLDGSGENTERSARLVAYLVANSDFKTIMPEKEDYLKNILLGEGGAWYVYRFMTKYNLPAGACYALELSCEKKISEILQHIERCITDTKDMAVAMDDTRIAVVKFKEEGQSPRDFAQFLNQSVYEELGLSVSVGFGCETGSFSEIAVSYHQAATAVRMSKLFGAKGEVHSYREYLLVKMLEEVPDLKLREYMEQFGTGDGSEVFEDEDMLSTAEEFLENSLNISETSRNLYMHRNTLMYRLDKIERITGLNIRKFSDAVTFRIITVLYKLLQR